MAATDIESGDGSKDLAGMVCCDHAVCIGTWFSHATFVIAYITAFVVAVLLVTLWLWNRVTQDSTVKKLQKELAALQGKMKDTSPELEQTQHVSDEIQL